MRLRELELYENIVIQMHDNPDADAIASGFGLYLYLKDKGKKVRLIYGGNYRIQKSNLVLMVSMLEIPVEYVEDIEEPELLITVDCQYGEGNVTKFPAETVVVIDHHQVNKELPPLSEVRSNLGSCSSLIREMLLDEEFDYNKNKNLATALYYGLLTDTNNFTEISHPLDKDLRDYTDFDKTLITRFCNSNLSLEEIRIAGEALINYQYFEKYRYASIQAESCDPNILGVISDMILEVDVVDTCLVYSIMPFGVKISIRSCTKHVRANELAEFLTEGIGSGGGHIVKAGGFIRMESITDLCEKQGLNADEEGIASVLNSRMCDYFDDVEIIESAEYEADLSEMKKYKKNRLPLGYVVGTDMFPTGTKVCVRTLETDMDITMADNVNIMIGLKGEVYPILKEKFDKKYKPLDQPYVFDGEYAPMVCNLEKGENISMIPFAKSCVVEGEVMIYAKRIDHRVKVFTKWDEEKYMLGLPGDYLAVCSTDLHDVYIVDGPIFDLTYTLLGDETK